MYCIHQRLKNVLGFSRYLSLFIRFAKYDKHLNFLIRDPVCHSPRFSYFQAIHNCESIVFPFGILPKLIAGYPTYIFTESNLIQSQYKHFDRYSFRILSYLFILLIVTRTFSTAAIKWFVARYQSNAKCIDSFPLALFIVTNRVMIVLFGFLSRILLIIIEHSKQDCVRSVSFSLQVSLWRSFFGSFITLKIMYIWTGIQTTKQKPWITILYTEQSCFLSIFIRWYRFRFHWADRNVYRFAFIQLRKWFVCLLLLI